MNKKMKKGFTLVELIVVIAVIGVLAAILILVVPGIIEKSHHKSALTDAKNSITVLAAETFGDDGDVTKIPDGTVVKVEKHKKLYYFNMNKGVLEDTDNMVEEEITTVSDMFKAVATCGTSCVFTSELDTQLAASAAEGIARVELKDLSDNVVIYATEYDLTHLSKSNIIQETVNTQIENVFDEAIQDQILGENKEELINGTMVVYYYHDDDVQMFYGYTYNEGGEKNFLNEMTTEEFLAFAKSYTNETYMPEYSQTVPAMDLYIGNDGDFAGEGNIKNLLEDAGANITAVEDSLDANTFIFVPHA